jgi:serine O-acetyltransferase
MELFDRLVMWNCHSRIKARRRFAAFALEVLYGCEINCSDIDQSVKFGHHARGATIIAAKICADAVIMQNVTIGTNLRFNKITESWENVGNPVIGKGVFIGDGAKILGPIIIGCGSVIGASAIVTKDVPPNTIVTGVNHQKPKDPNYDIQFHLPMPEPAQFSKANKLNAKRYQKIFAK